MKSIFSIFLLLLLCIGLLSCSSQNADDPNEKYEAPEWAEGIVWYQIFPERFRDGDPNNQPNRERARGPEGWLAYNMDSRLVQKRFLGSKSYR